MNQVLSMFKEYQKMFPANRNEKAYFPKPLKYPFWHKYRTEIVIGALLGIMAFPICGVILLSIKIISELVK
jgi:hypothetical protein